jgi:hypothetical protein
MGLRFTPYLNMLFMAPAMIVTLFSIVLIIATIGYSALDSFKRKNK